MIDILHMIGLAGLFVLVAAFWITTEVQRRRDRRDAASLAKVVPADVWTRCTAMHRDPVAWCTRDVGHEGFHAAMEEGHRLRWAGDQQ